MPDGSEPAVGLGKHRRKTDRCHKVDHQAGSKPHRERATDGKHEPRKCSRRQRHQLPRTQHHGGRCQKTDDHTREAPREQQHYHHPPTSGCPPPALGQRLPRCEPFKEHQRQREDPAGGEPGQHKRQTCCQDGPARQGSLEGWRLLGEIVVDVVVSQQPQCDHRSHAGKGCDHHRRKANEPDGESENLSAASCRQSKCRAKAERRGLGSHQDHQQRRLLNRHNAKRHGPRPHEHQPAKRPEHEHQDVGICECAAACRPQRQLQQAGRQGCQQHKRPGLHQHVCQKQQLPAVVKGLNHGSGGCSERHGLSSAACLVQR